MWLFQKSSVRRSIEGIEVIDLLAANEADSHLIYVADALHLLARHNPVLLRRIRTHVKTVAVSDSRTGYLAGRGICILNAKELDRQSPAESALSIAHEGTHAAIEAAGFRYSEANRDRIEKICIRAEVRLAKRIGGSELLDRAEKKLDLVWWRDDQMRAVREQEWRRWGLPELLIRLRRAIKGGGAEPSARRVEGKGVPGEASPKDR